jgi:alpha-N-arabinofuranosidase
MQRRTFLKTGALAGAAFALSSRPTFAASADAHIEILTGEPIATISPDIYGHFTEHIGGVVYDGIWVGEHSPIPNTRGIRTALTDKLKAIHAPVVRWPGGCFADSYDWKDGIGPRDQRPRRTNFWEGDPGARKLSPTSKQIIEPNEFGTSEFVDFCRQSGAQPYIAANLRSLPALDFDHWIEYCNSPAGSTTLAGVRAAGGFPDPFPVRYWGVGNESWGCGGNFTPEEYASEFRRFTTWTPGFGVDLQFIGSGSSDNDIDWTHRFFENIYGPTRPYSNPSFVGWSVHHYAWNLSRGRTSDWVQGKGDAIQFDPIDWYELFHEGAFIEQIITDQWAAMGLYDREHRIRLVLDEYGPWYRPGTELDPSHLVSQQVTLRDAVFTAFTLDIFNRHADKVMLAACAQLINCLNALFFAHEDKFIVTPNYHVFDMYAAHQGAQSLRTEIAAPRVHYSRDGKPASFWGLNGSASLRGKQVTLTVTNPHVSEARETQIVLRGAHAASATAQVLTDADIHAHNSFEHPDQVRTTSAQVAGGTDGLTFTFPPASVTKISIDLA